MNNEIRYLAQHLLHAGVSPLSERDRRVIQRVARRTYVARNLNQVFDNRVTAQIEQLASLQAAAMKEEAAEPASRPAFRIV